MLGETGQLAGGLHCENERQMMEESAPEFVRHFAKDRLLDPIQQSVAKTFARSHAFGLHSTRTSVEELGFSESPDAWPKILLHASVIYDASSLNVAHSGPKILHYVIWGPEDVAERTWRDNHDSDYQLKQIGTSTFGKVVG